MCPIDVRVEASVRHGANSDVADRTPDSEGCVARAGSQRGPHATMRFLIKMYRILSSRRNGWKTVSPMALALA